MKFNKLLRFVLALAFVLLTISQESGKADPGDCVDSTFCSDVSDRIFFGCSDMGPCCFGTQNENACSVYHAFCNDVPGFLYERECLSGPCFCPF
jgi:hypothetical protein